MKKILVISIIILAAIGAGCNSNSPETSLAGKWVGLDFITFDGAQAKSAVLLTVEQSGAGFSGKFTAVLSAAEPAIRTMEGNVDEASLSFRQDGSLLWTVDRTVDRVESSNDYPLPASLILYRDRTDEFRSEEQRKMEIVVQEKINADPQYQQKAFAYVEQIVGDYARLNVQTYEGDDVARVYLKQTVNGWEAVTDIIPLSETDIGVLNPGIPVPLF